MAELVQWVKDQVEEQVSALRHLWRNKRLVRRARLVEVVPIAARRARAR